MREAGGARRTEVVLTGTGIPFVHPDRAGAGVLVRRGSTAFQVDAGRATTLRLAAAGQSLHHLDAVLLTHHHSDHLVGLPDLVMSRWLMRPLGVVPLRIVAPEGPAARFAQRMLEPYEDDIAVRLAHVDREDGPDVETLPFEPGGEPREVCDAGGVTVRAVAVHHEPVLPSVAYRFDTPEGAVVVSGDTRVCAEVEALAAGASVLVHECVRRQRLAGGVSGSPLARIFEYHADTIELGEMAARAQPELLVLTHLIPPPNTPAEEAGFVEDVRSGGYEGPLVVGRDLVRVVLRAGRAPRVLTRSEAERPA